MYAFLVLGFPLAVVLLDMIVYPKDELVAMRRAFVRGLVAAFPVWLLSRLLGLVLPSFPGSILSGFGEWLDRFLPYALLPALAYAVFYHHHERLAPGVKQRRLTSFYAGCLAFYGLGEMTRVWGHASLYTTVVLPFLLAATALAAPRIVIAFLEGWGARRFLVAAGGILATLAAGFVLPLFLARLWPLALLLAALLCAGAWFLAMPGLLARAPAAESTGTGGGRA